MSKWTPPLEGDEGWEPRWPNSYLPKKQPKPKPEAHDCDICGWHIPANEEQHPHKGLLDGLTLYLCDLCQEREQRNLVPAYDQHKHGRRGPFWPWEDPKDLVRDA